MAEVHDATRLGPGQRSSALERMADEEFDIAIVGGGVTGAGAALDAATRGLRVALVEQRDYASGTSSRSSKLFHGGLRYLEQLDFRLVTEALAERNLMLERLCPHLATPISFLYPLRHRVWERMYVGAGVLLYDLLARAGRSPLPRHRHLSRRRALAVAPSLRRDALIGAIRYWDARVDDARHTMMLARTAAGHGAALASSARVIRFLRAEDRVAGMVVRDLESGTEIAVRARAVINATGVWTDRVQDLAGRSALRVRASKGIHLVVPADRIRAATGIITRTEKSVLFVIPWDEHWIIGTTDTDWNLDLAHPAASRTDIDYLLAWVNAILASPLGHDDVVGVYAGLRPLLHGEDDATSKLSREHAVTEAVPGLITVAGGKYTTYRVMGRDAVDAAIGAMDARAPGSVTEHIPLVGAEGFPALWNRRRRLAADAGRPVAEIERLLRRYGTRLDDLLAAIAARPDLGEPIRGGGDYLRAEIRYAASHEGALHLDDVLTRRTRISIETPDRGITAAGPTASLMAEVLGWDETTIAREIEHYRARVEAERDSQRQPDDHTADAARLGAPDVRTGGG